MNQQDKNRDELLNDPDVRRIVTHRLFDAIVDSDTRLNHLVLDRGIAPADWPGWKTYAPPLGRGCRCTLIAITDARAHAMIESGKGFDLTKGVPEGAGPDLGWDRTNQAADEQIDPRPATLGDPLAEAARDLWPQLKPLVGDRPGVLQVDLYRMVPDIPRQEVSYSLYLAHKDGLLLRKKKGNTYELRLP